MPVITPLTAREMAAKSVAAREQARLERIAKANAPVQPPLPTDKEQDALRVYARLQELDRMMGEAESDEAWDRLSRSYERLFRCWQVLSRTPGPGQLRPVEPGRRQARYWEKPVVMRPIDTTGSGQQPPALPGTTGSGQS